MFIFHFNKDGNKQFCVIFIALSYGKYFENEDTLWKDSGTQIIDIFIICYNKVFYEKYVSSDFNHFLESQFLFILEASFYALYLN